MIIKKSCLFTIITFGCVCLMTIIFINITNKTSSKIWEKNCSFVNENRQVMEKEIESIIIQNISAKEKINKIKDYISSLYKENEINIEYIDVFIENIPDSDYIVTIDYSIKHCKKNENIKFVIKKGGCI